MKTEAGGRDVSRRHVRKTGGPTWDGTPAAPREPPMLPPARDPAAGDPALRHEGLPARPTGRALILASPTLSWDAVPGSHP